MAWIVGAMLLVVPWLEIWLLFTMNFSLSGAVVLSVATAGAGWWFSRGEDLSLWSELESGVLNGRLPTEEGLDAMLTLAGGWALICPGLLTDMAGAALLFPAVRRVCIPPVRQLIRQHLL